MMPLMPGQNRLQLRENLFVTHDGERFILEINGHVTILDPQESHVFRGFVQVCRLKENRDDR